MRKLLNYHNPNKPQHIIYKFFLSFFPPKRCQLELPLNDLHELDHLTIGNRNKFMKEFYVRDIDIIF